MPWSTRWLIKRRGVRHELVGSHLSHCSRRALKAHVQRLDDQVQAQERAVE